MDNDDLAQQFNEIMGNQDNVMGQLMNYCVYETTRTMTDHIEALYKLYSYKLVDQQIIRAIILDTMFRRFGQEIQTHTTAHAALAAAKERVGEITFTNLTDELDKALSVVRQHNEEVTIGLETPYGGA